MIQAIIRFEGEGEAKAAWESAVTDATDGKVMVKEVEVQGRLLEGINNVNGSSKPLILLFIYCIQALTVSIGVKKKKVQLCDKSCVHIYNIAQQLYP